MQEITELKNRYNMLGQKLNCMNNETPLRMKNEVRNEMRLIAEDLTAIGLTQDYFGRWE